MGSSVDQLCEEALRLRKRWDALRPRLNKSLRRLHVTVDDYVKVLGEIDGRRKSVRSARLGLHRTRLDGRDIREVFSKRKPQ